MRISMHARVLVFIFAMMLALQTFLMSRLQTGKTRNQSVEGSLGKHEATIGEAQFVSLPISEVVVWDKDAGAGPLLLLSSHGSLVLYNPVKDLVSVVDRGNGIYYGIMPGSVPGSVWISRVRKAKKHQPDQLLLFDLGVNSDSLKSSRDVSTVYMHDAVVTPDRTLALLCDVKGPLLKLQYPSMKELARFPVFKEKDHPNTLCPTRNGTAVWVMLLNEIRDRNAKEDSSESSKIILVDLTTGKRLCELHKVGKQAHGLVLVDGGRFLLLLSSAAQSLVRVRVPDLCQDVQEAQTETLWTYPAREDQPSKFLKGLAVVDDIAYFGMSDLKKKRKARASVSTTLMAFSLRENRLLWHRDGLGTEVLTYADVC
jgi:hypothetical protein